MKELNRTDRLTIAAVTFAVILLIGFITLREPEVSYSHDIGSTLDLIVNSNESISQDELFYSFQNKESRYIVIDLRNPADYQKSHIEGAINIPVQEILLSENLEKLKGYGREKLTMVVYSAEQIEANSAWLVLKQTGVDEIRVLEGGYGSLSMPGAAFQLKGREDEKPLYDFRQITNQMGSSPASVHTTRPEPVIVTKKNKKSAAEGGC